MKTNELLTTAATMAKLGYATPDAAIAYLRRHGVTPARIGSRLMWRAAAVDALIASLAQHDQRSV